MSSGRILLYHRWILPHNFFFREVIFRNQNLFILMLFSVHGLQKLRKIWDWEWGWCDGGVKPWKPTTVRIFKKVWDWESYYSPVRCPIWAHGLSFYNSCIYVGYCDVIVLLCTLLCCSSSWCHVCPCLAFVLFSLYVSQLFFIISNWTHKPHFWVLMQSKGRFWRWTIEVSNYNHYLQIL